MKKITVAGYTFFVHPEHEAKAEALGLDIKYIRTRFKMVGQFKRLILYLKALD